MKNLLLSTLFLLLGLKSYSQTPYSNYWDDTSEWRYFTGGFDGISGYSYYSTTYFDGYEVLNGISYYKEYTNQLHQTTSWTGELISETTLYGPILTREDAQGNFYRIAPDSGVEYLTFSNQQILNAQVGDTFPADGASCTVSQIETNYVGARALKRVYGSLTGASNGTLEGVGVIGSNCALAYESNGWLNCYTKQNTTIQFGNINCAAFPPANRVGLANLTNQLKKFSVYPNPNNGLVKINMSSTITDVDFVIYNMNGSKIKEGKVTSNEASIDITSFSSGVYLVKLSANTTSEYFKLIKN